MRNISARTMAGAGSTEFGVLLRQHRQAASLSQEALAERAGLSVDAIGVIERGKRGGPRPDTIALLPRRSTFTATRPRSRSAPTPRASRVSSRATTSTPRSRASCACDSRKEEEIMEPINAPEKPIYSTGPYSVVLKQPQPNKDHLILRSPDVVHILPVTTEGQVVLLREARYGAGCRVLEAPAGGIDAGEDAIGAARRELREELGYACDDMTRVGTPGAFSSPGVLSERSTFVVARGCHAATDEHEDIPTVSLTPDEALALIASPGPDAQPAPNPEDVVADVKTMLLLVLARQARLI